MDKEHGYVGGSNSRKPACFPKRAGTVLIELGASLDAHAADRPEIDRLWNRPPFHSA
jgi:hypothetical protein